jgi:hypothetical protein
VGYRRWVTGSVQNSLNLSSVWRDTRSAASRSTTSVETGNGKSLAIAGNAYGAVTSLTILTTAVHALGGVNNQCVKIE